MSSRNFSEILKAYSKCSDGYLLDADGGNESKSWDGARLTFDGASGVLPNVPARQLNLPYAIHEFLWYCRGDRFDDSITKHASMWKKLKQDDGGFNSNYGQYLFKPYMTPVGTMPSQFDFCVGELVKSPSSRRACMTLLNSGHAYPQNTDMVCTYAIQFFIRDDCLEMHVYMRSNDVVFGLTNDAFCFNMIQRMVVAALRQAGINVGVGAYFHNAGTLHVYKRHYVMVRQAYWEARDYVEINPPMIDDLDLEALRHDQAAVGGGFMAWCRQQLGAK